MSFLQSPLAQLGSSHKIRHEGHELAGLCQPVLNQCPYQPSNHRQRQDSASMVRVLFERYQVPRPADPRTRARTPTPYFRLRAPRLE